MRRVCRLATMMLMSGMMLTAAVAPAVSSDAPVFHATGDGASLLWHRHLENAIYTSCALEGWGGHVIAGTQINAPKQVEVASVSGTGDPLWTSPGTNFFVDASRKGVVLAAVDFRSTDSSAVISEWRAGSSTPLWSYTVHPCRALTYAGWADRKPIQVSDDGSTIAVGITMYGPSGLKGRLYVFQSGQPVPAHVYDLATGPITAVAITPPGRFVAMTSWPTIYVYDTVAGALRWSAAMGDGNDALAISSTGRYLAWGWTSFNLREWTGAAYTPAWTEDRPGDYYVGQCAFSDAEDLLALAWDNGLMEPNEIYLDMYELPSLALRWEHDFGDPEMVGQSDVPSHMVFSNDGAHVAVSTLGGCFPEVQVFHASAPDPVFTLDTPGSMYDVDIVAVEDIPAGGSWTNYVTACGKAIYTGTPGRGGDLYAIEIPPPVATSVGAGLADRRDTTRLGAVSPNPFSGRTSIRYSVGRTETARLTIHDARGRLVRSLPAASGTGEQAFQWDGTDNRGATTPSGVYTVRLEFQGSAPGAGRTETRKIVRIR